jgi:hypothetical protein
MKKQNTNPLAEASAKFSLNPVSFQFDLPMLEMIIARANSFSDFLDFTKAHPKTAAEIDVLQPCCTTALHP